jgi:hypothetical protein
LFVFSAPIVGPGSVNFVGASDPDSYQIF